LIDIYQFIYQIEQGRGEKKKRVTSTFVYIYRHTGIQYLTISLPYAFIGSRIVLNKQANIRLAKEQVATDN